MWRERRLLLFAGLVTLLQSSHGCQMDGVANWFLTVSEEIYDTQRGVFFNRSTSAIEEVLSINTGEGVNAGLYLSISLDDSYFTVTTTDAFALYEENETSESMSFTVNFRCTGGSTNLLVFDIQIRDTNNNPPTFRPSNQYEFTITPPLPPNFQITGCLDDNIIVRDIDLTTERIDFEIEDNPYFEIVEDGRSATDPKEFIAVLRTKDLIRSLPEALELTISATDVDRTGDPQITTTGTIRIQANDDFQFPEELVFSQPFYTASYSNGQLTMQELISLQQGYHQEVVFSLDGEHVSYFNPVRNGNEISISVISPLPSDILRTGQLILVVLAEREHTSGDSATVIVQLPEVLGLEFEQMQYQGAIIDNELQPLQLNLIQGYEDGVNITLLDDLAAFFATDVQGNVITLTMMPLDSQIIDENNFISLRVEAANGYSSSTAVVTLDIIKDDSTTPVFEKAIYTGDYDPDIGLTLESITLVQGYDATISFSLQGEHSAYFQISPTGPNVLVTSSTIPPEVWEARQLYLTLEATKPRTVNPVAVISISMPAERELAFEVPTYTGTLQDDTLTIPPIVLTVGYSENVTFDLSGDYANFFTLSNTQNQVSINLSASLPEDVILDNNFLTLTLSASGMHAVPTSTMVVLEIIKQDVTTPVFNENIYRAIYFGDNSFEMPNISLSQGYDNTVNFRLDGEHSQYFRIGNEENNLNLFLDANIPPEVIFREKVLLFNVLADKPLTIGANSAVSITFPQELTDATIMIFSRNAYEGSIENNELSLENIVLESGYDNGTEFLLTGEFASHFLLQSTDNVISISLSDTFGTEILENSFVVLEIEANRERAVPVSSSIIIEIVKEEIESPLFSEAFYRGAYAENGLHFEEQILLSQGFDDTVSFGLVGENAVWFSISQNDNSVSLSLNGSNAIPDSVLETNNHLLFAIVATKPDAFTGTAAISIDLIKEVPEPVIMRFTQSSYVGRIDNGELFAPTISLVGAQEPIELNLTGEYASYFELSRTSNDIQITLTNELPAEVINQLAFIILDIQASSPGAINGYTSIVLEIINQPQIATPVFEQAYYTGEYSEQGLQFEQSIRLIQGFDETVLFTLAGDDAQWFELVNIDESTLSLVVTDGGLGQIRDRSHLVFSVLANKPQSVAGHAAIIVNLSGFSSAMALQFAQNFYLGTIDSGNITLSDIQLEEGFSQVVNMSIIGDHAEYFEITRVDEIFTLHLSSEMPADILNTNNVLVFTIVAQVEDTRAHTTVILEVIKIEVSQLAFEQAYYAGTYSLTSGLTFDPQITLIEGYDETVLFSLEGDHSQWFGTDRDMNSISLVQTNPIPVDVVSNNQQLVFIIVAEKPGSINARSTIIISIIDDTVVLGFERNVYLGEIQNDVSNIEAIVLSEGYSENVTFALFGELSSYFIVESEGASLQVSLQSSIPEELIPNAGIIILELQAERAQAIPAYTTLVFGVARDSLGSRLDFSETYYTGFYTEAGGLTFDDTITLTEGYDENTQFSLEGETSQYFEIDIIDNSVTLNVLSPIPPAVVMNNNVLVFTINADKPGAITAKAVIVISLTEEYTEGLVLGFDRISYVGSIENGTAHLDTITLSEGFTQNVSFTLHGDLSNYFTMTPVASMVEIELQTPIPEEMIPENRIIILELQASAPESISAFAVVVFEVVAVNNIPDQQLLIFGETYYTGHYTNTEGLLFENTISLIEGYDETVVFELEGDSSQYFEAQITDNSVTIVVIIPIPPAIVMNNQQLFFVIRADKDGLPTARATIIISLLDEHTNDILGFDRITYLGSIENGTVTLGPITLSEGYSQNVTFTLNGDLANYFTLTPIGPTATLSLQSAIPEQLLPENGIVILEVQASSPDTMSAHAAIVLDIIREDSTPSVEPLIFSETYYTGRYADAAGLVFEDNMTLVQGYDETVQFSLEGDSSQYFEAEVSGNSVTLRVITLIPPATIMNNQQLIFTLRADKPQTSSIRATIVISLLNELSDDVALGFERITYLGTLENQTIILDPITLSEGYTQDVTFTLHGDLETYFVLSPDGATVYVALENSIPEELIANTGIVVLEIQASAPQAMPAFAAIVLKVIKEESLPQFEQLTFNEAYYTGSYSETGGLVFEDTILLSEGFDDNVQFILEGESAQYFEEVVTGNSVTLMVATPIPSGVVAANHQLIFTIQAAKPNAVSAKATIVISLIDEINEELALGFDRIYYQGTIQNNEIDMEAITLTEGYSENVVFTVHGDLASYFVATSENALVTINLQTLIPEQSLPSNGIIVLELQASALNTSSAYATIVIEVVQANINVEQLLFSETFFTGHYTELDGLTFGTITLIEGYDDNVLFTLEGESAQYFETVVSGSSVTLQITTPIPGAVVINNQHLIFEIHANKPDANTAKATIVIALRDEHATSNILGFERISYTGSIENEEINIETITLIEGYSEDIRFSLHGDLASYFLATSENALVTINLQTLIPEQSLPSNGIIVLELQASALNTSSAYATIVIEVVQANINVEQLLFSETFFTGDYTELDGLTFGTITLIEGYDDNVLFTLEGDSAQYFETVVSGSSVTLHIATPIPGAVVINNQHLIFEIHANKPDANTAKATIVIALRDEHATSNILGFERISYTGSIENEETNIETITLIEGYSEDIRFSLHGGFANYFNVTSEGATIIIVLTSSIPEQEIPENRIIVLELQASAPETISAYATVIIDVIQDDIEELAFIAPYFLGHYSEGIVVLEDTIFLSLGYDDNVEFFLEGENSQWFQLDVTGNVATLSLMNTIPQEILESNRKLVFVIAAQKPGATTIRATIIISLETEDGNDSGIRFEKIIFEGLVQGGTVLHETITVIGFDGSDIQILGDYAGLFIASASNGVVSVEGVGSITLPDSVSYVALELQAGTASAVLVLNVIQAENPDLPTLEFTSPSYILRVDISQTGLVGRVEATAGNGEAIIYSLDIDNEHLLQRISINDEGELHLSAPANSGVYSFNVVATTIFSQATATAAVHLTVEAVTTCGEDDLVLPPLIILDRDEESAHQNLVVLNGTEFQGCTYRLANRWPVDQSWLYVDENGLHTTAIDREHESIAFMALSQVQVELFLECDTDNIPTVNRAKRSVNTASRLDHLGPYDYGDNKWILTDSILYNPRRSFVNLIVNDINDNAPIFIGKEDEPIAVGYPVPDLEERILPRALTKVEATDADVGENAALVYWSMEGALAVSPQSGFVHIHNNAQLEDNTILTVYATDQNGQGLNGSLDLMVKLIDTSHIAVVTIQNAFLEDEDTILNNLRAAIGYEVKALRSTIISDDMVPESGATRNKRNAVLSTGASLQLYVYGLIEQEPVAVEQLTENINSGVIGSVIVASTVSLEDHLESLQICPLAGRDTGLLAATITLSVLLFILIVAAAVWFYLTWRKKQNYDQFSDENSLASRNESLAPAPKPDNTPKPRMNIEELIRSERRLQEMLEAPVEDETAIQPSTAPKVLESKVNIPEAPIVIQSIDKLKDGDESEDDDEFGERLKQKRKSVVTFNENVEKIIHVEDPPEDPEFEVYKL